MAKQSKKLKNSKFRVTGLVVFSLIIGILGYVILFQSNAAVPAAPTMYLTPESMTLAPNTTFTVTVRENSGTTPTSGAQADFTYPANLVDFVGIDSTGSPFTSQVKASGSNGQISIVRALLESPFPTGDQLLAVVTFKTKTAVTGTATMAFNLETGIINANNPSVELLGSLSRTQGANITVDGQSPTASVTAPAAGTSISSGTTTPITVSATDNTGVSSVAIYVDNALKTTLTASPFTYSWNTTGLSLGNHTIYAIAKDAYGNSVTSSTITVSVADKTPPTVSLTAPASPVKGTVTLNATAADTGGTSVTKVEFYAGTTLIGTDTSSPYQANWVTTNGSFPDNTYSLTAKAYDGASPANTTTSSAVSVVVENTDKTVPTTPSNLRMTATSLNSLSLAWNASTDNVGVTGYKVSRNGGTPTTVTTLTFNDTGLTSGTTYNYSVIAVDAANNQSAAATVSVSTASAKTGDLNLDNKVDLVDLGIMINKWGTTDATCDLNKNGKVDLIDLALFISNYNK